jgi:hypothetical protein
LVTRTVDTGPGGENDPNRALAAITRERPTRPNRARALNATPTPATPPAASPWLGDVAPVRVRKLYFSEKLQDPANPNSATDVLRHRGRRDAEAVRYAKSSDIPDIVVRQGDVEDWIIENRIERIARLPYSPNSFLLMDWSGTPVNEPFLRDTVNVPYYNGRMLAISERAAAHGFSRSQHRRHLRVSLPPART